MHDRFDLQRFVDAQAPIYQQALAELRAGGKRSHWMWFVFPQIEGLGHSSMAQRYAISGLEEARAYLAHPLLGPRLRECAEALLMQRNRSAHDILGTPDDLKLRSSMTLFDHIAPEDIFERVLTAFHRGERDQATLGRLG